MEQNKIKSNNTDKRSQPPRQARFKYSLLTIVLAVCIIELLYSNIQNITKNINHQSKIKALIEKKNEELEKNKQLKSEIENFNSDEILESIVRNNLKMAGKDEILIIINNKEETKPEEQEIGNKNRKVAKKATYNSLQLFDRN